MKFINRKNYLIKVLKTPEVRDVLSKRRHDTQGGESIYDKDERYAGEMLNLKIPKIKIEIDQLRLKYSIDNCDNFFNSLYPLLIILGTFIAFNLSLSELVTKVKQPINAAPQNQLEKIYNKFIEDNK